MTLQLYIPGGNTGRRETFKCKYTFPHMEVQSSRLRFRDLGMLAEILRFLMQKIKAHALCQYVLSL